MNKNTRACIAYVANALVNGSTGTAVYDYAHSKHITIQGSVEESRVQVYDHDRGCHFQGTATKLYDYGRNAHVTLSILGDKFKGFDYGDGQHFTGSVNGRNVTIYDYAEAQYFQYQV
jgi:hypothetical protein